MRQSSQTSVFRRLHSGKRKPGEKSGENGFRFFCWTSHHYKHRDASKESGQNSVRHKGRNYLNGRTQCHTAALFDSSTFSRCITIPLMRCEAKLKNERSKNPMLTLKKTKP